MSRLSVLTRRNNFSNMPPEEIYTGLRELSKENREELQAILDDVPLTRCFDRYRVNDLEDGD